ncbi:hypothetical protein PAMP_020576 [Pampus punctatissimus]
MPSRRTTSSNPIPPSPSSPPPPAPPRPPLRSRRKSKSPSSRSNYATPKRALDVDKIGTNDDSHTRQTCRGSRDLRGSQGSELDRKWEGVALELRCRGSRMRSTVYQTSELPSMVKAKRQLEQNEDKRQIDKNKLKATFV